MTWWVPLADGTALQRVKHAQHAYGSGRAQADPARSKPPPQGGGPTRAAALRSPRPQPTSARLCSLAAAGARILQANQYYTYATGTSMAAPYVSAAAGLAIAASGGRVTNAEVRPSGGDGVR